jgi:NitT/TauT family transport system substrate-binding protein
MKNNTYFIIVIISLVFIASTFFVYKTKATTTTTTTTTTTKIIFGINEWPGCLGLYIARDLGYFKDEGLDIEFKNYISLQDLSSDYISTNMDGRTNIVPDAIMELGKKLDQKIVLIIDYSNGADAIVTSKKEITTIKDLKGKSVAHESDSLGEFFLNYLMYDNGLTDDDITPVHANPEEASRLLMDSKVDVAVTFEPYISKILENGKFHNVFTSADAPGLITDVITFKTDFIKKNPEAIASFTKAYFKGIDFWKKNPDKAEEILAKTFNVSKETARNQLKGVKILDLNENKNAMNFSPEMKSIYGILRKVALYYKIQNIQENVLDTDALIYSNYIYDLVN